MEEKNIYDEICDYEPDTHEQLVRGLSAYKIAVIYARYSSDRQTEQSIEGQVRVCKEYAERNGIKIVGIYIDRAMTGTNDNREEFQRMLKDSDKRLWDYVLIYKLDRFSRNKYEMAIHRKHLKDNGIKILSAMENIPDSPEGILLESLFEGMNQYYSEELSQKTRRGQRETRLKGLCPGGRIPYGWDKTPERKAVINKTEAAVVKDIFDMYLSGMTMLQISNSLNERGIINKDRPFLESTIYTMLHNERYTGIMRVRDDVYDKIFPPIITKEIFDMTQELLDKNSRGKHVHDDSYLLRGKVDCGYCGKRYASWGGNDRNGNPYKYYKCGNGKCHEVKAIRKDVLENAVLTALGNAVNTESNMELLANAIMEQQRRTAEENIELRLLEKEQGKVLKSIAGIMKAIEMGVVTETTKERLEELERQKCDLAERIFIAKSREQRIIPKEVVKNYLRNALTKPPQVMIDLLIEKVTIFKDRIDVTLKYTNSTPPDGDRPKKWHRYSKDSDPNDRGFLFKYYDYTATELWHRKEHSRQIQLGVYFRA
ncbi:MAG: recombinase family protein [Roseburia sp.]|nr:recombinase family protein [Roseburia sp.]